MSTSAESEPPPDSGPPDPPRRPTQEELAQLPRAAIAAYAARCACRALPYLVREGRIASTEGGEKILVRAAECAIAYAIACSAGIPYSAAAATTARAYAASYAASSSATAAYAAAYGASYAARAAAADDAAAYAADATASAAAAVVAAADTAAANDFRRLKAEGRRVRPKTSDIFKKPLWPGGSSPPGWAGRVEGFYRALELIGCADVADRYRRLTEGKFEISKAWLTDIENRWQQLRGGLPTRASAAFPSDDSPSPDPAPSPLAPKPVIDPIGTGVASDLPTLEDRLGQGRLVRGLCAFLRSERTKTPLTLSIEARWGAGKSSFMLQLKAALPKTEFATVWFNPWRHEKNEELWAAFALCLAGQLRSQMGLFWRIGARARYLFTGLNRDEAILGLHPVIWKMIGWLFAVVLGVLALNRGYTVDQLKAIVHGDFSLLKGLKHLVGFTGGSLAVAFSAIEFANSCFGRPAVIADIKRHLDRPDYASYTTFLERFHRDFRRLLRSYAGERKIVVFIDDLDRCDVPRAAELVQGINLLMSGAEPESVSVDTNSASAVREPRLIFILGIDRAKVAAGIAVKHEKLLPYLYAERFSRGPEVAEVNGGAQAGSHSDSAKEDGELQAQAGPSLAEVNRVTQIEAGLEYGYEYLEKFIQIPFRLPRPGPERLADYIGDLIQCPAPGAKPAVTPVRADDMVTPAGTPPVPGSESERSDSASPTVLVTQENGRPAPLDRERTEPLPLPTEIDEHWMRGPALLAAPLFDYNPRRLKQFVALLRLTAYLFRGDESAMDGRTLRQLGKFLAATMKWPHLAADLELYPSLFEALGSEGGIVEDPIVAKWRINHELVAFIERKPEPPELDASEEDYDLRRADIPTFLRIAAVTTPTRESSPPPPASPPA